MSWYLVHTKPRQENWALQNLEQQGYECYLPILSSEKLRQGKLGVVDEPLFPRYLFIRLGKELTSKGWGPIRSTKGVSRLVCFGNEPAKVDDRFIDAIKNQEQIVKSRPYSLYSAGDQVIFSKGAFKGIEGIYQMADGESRVIVLIELLNRPMQVSVPPVQLRKIG